MPKIVKIAFPKDGTVMRMSLPDETIEYMKSLVIDGTYASLEDALSGMTLRAINLNNKFRKALKFPVDFPYTPNMCPICNHTGLEETHKQTQLLGFKYHCPSCFYSFPSCPNCHQGVIYELDREEKEKIKTTEYCTQCEYEHVSLIQDNFRYVDFHDIVPSDEK